MGLLADIRAEATPPRARCTLAVIAESLDKADAADLAAAIADLQITHAAIARVLTARGHRVAAQTVGRHRSRECSCG